MSRKSGKANVPPIVWGVFLWIVVPAALFVAGYKVIGPRIGEVPALKAQVAKVEDLIANKAPAAAQRVDDPKDEDAKKSANGPDIEVTVEKSKVQPKRKPTRRRTRKEAPQPKRETAPARDEASGDGAMSGGDGPSDAAGGG